MKPRTLLIPACTILFSCHGPSGSSAIVLTKANLYSIDTVRLAMGGGDEKAAGKLLKEAADLYKKGGDTVKSIGLFEDAILLKPSAKAYYDLAGALLGWRQYKEATAALYIAEKLGYTPLANVLFKKAYAYANIAEEDHFKENQADAVHYMEVALQMGYPHPQQFLRKDLFPALAKYDGFESVYNAALGGGAGRNIEKSLWETYQAQFPDIQLPLIVNEQWIMTHRLDNNIGWEYEKFIPEMRNNKFSRGGEEDYFYIALVRKDLIFTAVLYGGELAQMEAPIITTEIWLATYDPAGKIIDRLMVAGRNSLSAPFKVFSLQPGLQFQVQGFQDIYKNDPDSVGYDSANITGQKALPVDGYRIAANGKFERTDAPLALR